MTNQISISHGNSKMGAIPSVSLPACITCNPSAPCFKKCYAAKLERIYKNTRNAYARNLDILETEPAHYWLQVKAAAISASVPVISFSYLLIKTDRYSPAASPQTLPDGSRRRRRDAPGWPAAAAVCRPVQRTCPW